MLMLINRVLFLLLIASELQIKPYDQVVSSNFSVLLILLHIFYIYLKKKYGLLYIFYLTLNYFILNYI